MIFELYSLTMNLCNSALVPIFYLVQEQKYGFSSCQYWPDSVPVPGRYWLERWASTRPSATGAVRSSVDE